MTCFLLLMYALLLFLIAYCRSPSHGLSLSSSPFISARAARSKLAKNEVNYRVVAFQILPNVQYILSRFGAKHVPARRPTSEDDKRLSSYGKYLRYSCNGRHTDSHYNYEGAFGIALVSFDTLWKEAEETNTPSVVFEENTKVLNADEVMRCVEFCVSENVDFMQIHTFHNGNVDGANPFPDRCPNAPRQKRVRPMRISTTGMAYPLTEIHTSMKCYFISPRFAKHMRSVAERYIDNLHIDVWLCMEARFPSGADHSKPFLAYVYHGDPPCVTHLEKPKTAIKIEHTVVHRN